MQSALMYGRVDFLLLTELHFSLFQGFWPILESSCCNISASIVNFIHLLLELHVTSLLN